MKIIRFTTQQLRQWRTNTHHLVDVEGHLVMQMPQHLETAVRQLERTAKARQKKLEQRVAIAGKEYAIVVDVTRTGIDASSIVVKTTIDGHRIVTGREVMAAQILQQNGGEDCQLRSPNNVILKMVRNPEVKRPSYKESLQIAPRPEHCPCKSWGNPHPGTHHVTCQWNRLAPPTERAIGTVIPEEEIVTLPQEAFTALAARPGPAPHVPQTTVARISPPAAQPVVDLDPPETCRNGCLAWATPKGFPIPEGHHHPTCNFAKAWAIQVSRDIPRWLVDLNTGVQVRHATDAEIGESDIVAQKTGSPIIHIDDVPYAVLLETELERERTLDVAANG